MTPPTPKKQNIWENIIWIVIGIGLTIAFFAFIAYLFKIMMSNIDKVSPNIIVAIIAGSITILGYYITRYFERKKAIEFQIREQKLPIYEEFVGFLFQILFDDKFKALDPKEQEKEMLKFLMQFNKKSIIWLSDESFSAYIKWKNLAANNSITEVPLAALADLFLAFRKDVGHTNKNINRNNLLSIFITDVDEYDVINVQNLHSK